MANAKKRYYWLKLPDDWFRQKSIKKLRQIAGGDTYTIIYLKMLLVAIKQDSRLYFEGVEQNFHEELALEIDEDPENVRIALSYLTSQHLIELVEGNEFRLPEAGMLTGSEAESAERVRRYRERKALQCNANVTQGNASVTYCNDAVTSRNGAVTDVKRLCNGEIEKEIEIDIEKEKDKEIDIYNNNIFNNTMSCPEASSGPHEKAKKTPPAGYGVEDAPTADSAKVIGAGAVRGVEGMDARTKKGAKGIGVRILNTAEPPEIFIRLPLNTGEMWAVTVSEVEEFQELYPAVDVRQQLRNMCGWLNANRKNRKTAKGIAKFINGWLAREQNRAPRVGSAGSAYGRPVPKKNQFNDFEHNAYDFDALEQELAGS